MSSQHARKQNEISETALAMELKIKDQPDVCLDCLIASIGYNSPCVGTFRNAKLVLLRRPA